jgi:hypothetical protein
MNLVDFLFGKAEASVLTEGMPDFDKNKAANALEAFNNGMPAEKIWEKFQVYPFPDKFGKTTMVGELQDTGAKLKEVPWNAVKTYGDILDHPQLYKNAPWLKGLPFTINEKEVRSIGEPLGGTLGQNIFQHLLNLPTDGSMINSQKYEPGAGVPSIVQQPDGSFKDEVSASLPRNPVDRSNELLEVLLHEAQHSIQQNAGIGSYFNGGGDGIVFGDKTDYYSNPDESQAYATTKRLKEGYKGSPLKDMPQMRNHRSLWNTLQGAIK